MNGPSHLTVVVILSFLAAVAAKGDRPLAHGKRPHKGHEKAPRAADDTLSLAEVDDQADEKQKASVSKVRNREQGRHKGVKRTSHRPAARKDLKVAQKNVRRGRDEGYNPANVKSSLAQVRTKAFGKHKAHVKTKDPKAARGKHPHHEHEKVPHVADGSSSLVEVHAKAHSKRKSSKARAKQKASKAQHHSKLHEQHNALNVGHERRPHHKHQEAHHAAAGASSLLESLGTRKSSAGNRVHGGQKKLEGARHRAHSTSLRIRQRIGRTAPVVGHLKPGAEFKASSSRKAKDGTVWLELADGRGWVPQGDVEQVSPSKRERASHRRRAVSRASSLNLVGARAREKPDDEYKALNMDGKKLGDVRYKNGKSINADWRAEYPVEGTTKSAADRLACLLSVAVAFLAFVSFDLIRVDY